MGWNANGDWEDDYAPQEPTTVETPSAPSAPSSPFDLNSLASRTGAPVAEGDQARIQEYQTSMAAGNTTQEQYDRFLQDLEAQYNRRGASTAHREGDSQNLDRATYYNPLLEKGAKPVSYTPPAGQPAKGLDYWRRMGVGPSMISTLAPPPTGGGNFPPLAPGYNGRGYTNNLNPGWTKDAQGNYSFTGKPGDLGADPKAPGAFSFGQAKPPVAGAMLPQFAGVGSPGKQFSDPITSAIEDYAARRAEERASPSANSGQAEFEKTLREVAAMLKGGGFTPAEQQVFQTQALDPIEQMRAARKQQVLQQLSQRGIDPNSGVGMSMLADVDRQFDAMRQQTQRGLAAQGAQETTARMQQAIELLSGLAGTENNRLNESYQYRQVPLQLADRAFNQASSLYNQTGNPMQGLQAALSMYENDQQRGDALQELLGYLAGLSQ